MDAKVALNFSKLILVKIAVVRAISEFTPIKVADSVNILVGILLEHSHIIIFSFSNRRD
jgi:hypothetical protein